MKLRSLLMVCVASAFVSIAIWSYFRFGAPPWLPHWLTFPLLTVVFPGHYFTQHVLPFRYLAMSCPGCEPAHKELVVSVVWLVLNVAFWTTAIFVGSVLFRFTRRLFRRASSNHPMERTAGSHDS